MSQNLQDLMREATSDLHARAGFVEDTVKGGRRRARHRRTALGAGLALGVAGLGVLGTSSDLGSRAASFATGGDQPRPQSSPWLPLGGGFASNQNAPPQPDHCRAL